MKEEEEEINSILIIYHYSHNKVLGNTLSNDVRYCFFNVCKTELNSLNKNFCCVSPACVCL